MGLYLLAEVRGMVLVELPISGYVVRGVEVHVPVTQLVNKLNTLVAACDGLSDYYHKVWNTNVLYRYTVDFTDRHRAEMDKITTLAELDALLAQSDLLSDFIAYAERNGVEGDDEGIAISREIIEAQLRAYIGRNALHDDAGFYYNIYPIDNTLKRAVAELETRLKKSKKKR